MSDTTTDAQVENIKQEIKREGRGPGHFGNPLALAQMKAEVKQEALVKQDKLRHLIVSVACINTNYS